jgi:hypothetical protein
MKNVMKMLALASLLAASTQLSGCASGMAAIEGLTTPPSISDTLDSFESAALAIKISNRILLEAPISEQEEWPVKLYKAPSAENSIKMAITGFAGSKGITIPTEFDPQTGFPRPTSPLYLLIKDRNLMLDKEINKTYLSTFKKDQQAISCAISKPAKDCIDKHAYKNPLSAYGVISNNSKAVADLEKELYLASNGYKECDAWVRKSKEGDVEPVACKDKSIKSDVFEKDLEIKQSKEEIELAKKNYGRLSKKVYMASVGGADFTAAAITKLVVTIAKFPLAVKNAPQEIKGWKGAINIAMLLPRIKNLFSAVGTYKDHLGNQITAYKMVYNNLQDKYDVKDDDKTKQAKLRIDRFEAAYKEIEPKLNQMAKGENIELTSAEQMKWEVLASMYPADINFDNELLLAGLQD